MAAWLTCEIHIFDMKSIHNAQTVKSQANSCWSALAGHECLQYYMALLKAF